MGWNIPEIATDPATRRHVRATLDAAVAHWFGLTAADMEVLLAGCAHSSEALRPASFRRGLDRKGFWRVDREEAPEDRHPRLAIARLRGLEASISAGTSSDQAIQGLLADPMGRSDP